MCPLVDAWDRGVEAALLAFGGQHRAVPAVAEVLERKHVAELDCSEYGVKVVVGGVVGVRPDPVRAAPPELAEVVGLHADRPVVSVGVDSVPHGWIAHVTG